MDRQQGLMSQGHVDPDVVLGFTLRSKGNGPEEALSGF